MTIATVGRLVEVVRESRLLEPPQLAILTETLQTQYKQPFGLAQEMLRRGWFTDYQLEQIIKGHGKELVLGNYILLDALGEGGMGQVFKARHKQQGQIVAIKVIRKERRADNKVLSRFRREVQAMARLSHPNIVTASDVAEAASAHYFAMEFFEGINLDQVIDTIGVLPIAAAVDFVRQAALGLQHANDQGLIHRDIKPGNLLITAPQPGYEAPRGVTADVQKRFGRWGIVKILDLGLVLLQQENANGSHQSDLTKKGFSLGTVDYVAPEQVMNPHSVDIRADLYSLGCTLYESLSGRLPFPEGSPGKKLYYHQTRAPIPVEELRSDIPPELAKIVARLMAKKPEERIQTPAELISALSGVLTKMSISSKDLDWKLPTRDDAAHSAKGGPKPRKNWLLPFVIGGAILVILGVVLIFIRR